VFFRSSRIGGTSVCSGGECTTRAAAAHTRRPTLSGTDREVFAGILPQRVLLRRCRSAALSEARVFREMNALIHEEHERNDFAVFD
jgi:hypothetical protein